MTYAITCGSSVGLKRGFMGCFVFPFVKESDYKLQALGISIASINRSFVPVVMFTRFFIGRAT